MATTKPDRRSFIALTTAALATIPVMPRPAHSQTDTNLDWDTPPVSELLVLYHNLLDDLNLQLKSDYLLAMIKHPSPQTYEEVVAANKRLQTLLAERENVDNAINSIKRDIQTAAEVLKGFVTLNQRSEVSRIIARVMLEMPLLSLRSAISSLRKLPTPGPNYLSQSQSETLIMILQVLVDSLERMKGPPSRSHHSTHSTPQMSITQAKQLAKQIIRQRFPPGNRVQVYLGFVGAWHILDAVSDEARRKRLLIECLKIVPCWGGDRDGAAAELARIWYQ